MWLYHRAPNLLVGETLYPLNVMRRALPSRYRLEIKKYEGREGLLKMPIPLLSCRWADAVFFTGVKPAQIRNAFRSAGFDALSMPDAYRWRHEDMDISRLAVMKYKDDGDVVFEKFEPDDIDLLGVPHRTIQYYRKCRKDGVRPLVHHLIPQILHRGSVDIGKAERISS